MTKLLWCPLMASLVVGVTSHIDLNPIPTGSFVTKLNSAQIFPELQNYTTTKISQATREIDEKTAFNLVWKLPEVQRKAREIQRLSKGTIRVSAIVDGSPTPDDPYYKVRVYEDQPDHNTTIYWFRVSSTSGVIEVLDVIENKYISLEEWKKQLRRR